MSPMTGAAPVPVPHPIPAVMNTMSVSWSIALMSSIFSSAALRPTSGSAPAPSPLVRLSQILILCGAGLSARSCASVLTATKSTPCSHSVIILASVLPHAPPHQITLILAHGMISGLKSCIVMCTIRR